MKLMFAIVNGDDSHSVASALTKAGYRATKLASKGGFLSTGNTTFMIACEDEKVSDIVEVIRTHSRKRKQIVTSEMAASVADATIFIVPIEKIERV